MGSIKVRSESDPDMPPRRPAGTDPELGDSEICAALVDGAAWAADALYDRVVDMVEAVLFRLLGADADHEDLIQQAIERVVSSVVTGRFARGCSLRSWATLLTQHVAVDALRARARERKLFDRRIPYKMLELVEDHTATPEHLAETRRRMALLQSALGRVSRERSEAVVLHDLLGHDLTEIAQLTGVSVAAAQSRLVRGRREVLAWIRAHEGTE
jgi:RNA polymerase sigma-70 factor (ECF subfamily)